MTNRNAEVMRDTARAGLLARTGPSDAAAQAYERAIGLESDPAVRRFLQLRSAEVAGADVAGADVGGLDIM